MTVFSERDLRQLSELGVTPAEVERQLALFAQPPPPIRLHRPCRIGDGIETLSAARQPQLLARADAARRAGRCSALVPASGAASRMFEAALGCLLSGAASDSDLELAAAAGEAGAIATQALLRGLGETPFAGELDQLLAGRGQSLHDLQAAGRNRELLEALLLPLPAGLDCARRPKALMPFHRYGSGARTAFEEQLRESASSVAVRGGIAAVHFTISREHQAAFEATWQGLRGRVAADCQVELDVTFSTQENATATLAVDLDNQPFRLADGSLLFRPGGHGALLGNLQALADDGADLVLLKNVDNVLPDAGRAQVVRWRSLLLGALLELEDELATWRRRAGEDAAGRAGAVAFLTDRFGVQAPVAASVPGYLEDRLRRPLRVCGMVRNQGQAGGGPFWAADHSGEVTRQIVEASQVARDPGQQAIMAASTHFNPVDLVCSLRDPEARPYELARYVDPSSVFLAEKSAEGQKLKALEWPGLWNGAMAGWNTVFIEVPAATFAPVKTVLDLLRPEHRGS